MEDVFVNCSMSYYIEEYILQRHVITEECRDFINLIGSTFLGIETVKYVALVQIRSEIGFEEIFPYFTVGTRK